VQVIEKLLKVFFLILLCCAPAQAGINHRINSGYFYSEGDYGYKKITYLHYVPVSYLYHLGRHRLGLGTGWLHIRGPSLEGVLTRPSAYSEGLADTYIRYQYRRLLQHRRVLVELKTQIKIPTADSKRGLGTGKYDADMRLAYRHFLRFFWLSAQAKYKWRQDLTTIELKETWGVDAGFIYAWSPGFSTMLQAQFEQAHTAFGENKKNIILLNSLKLARPLSLSIYISKGFSLSSPQWSSGLQTTLSW